MIQSRVVQRYPVLLQKSKHMTRYLSTEALKKVMRHVPQPVTVVTSAMIHARYGLVKRGVTCSSLTSITLQPPTLSVSIYKNNIINEIISNSGVFCANLLSDKQVRIGMHFSQKLNADFSYNQMDSIPHTDGVKSVPVLDSNKGWMQCDVNDVQFSGDHTVWFGVVSAAQVNDDPKINPMLYFNRSFRSIGDEIFMQAFESTTMPFEEWTHEAHIRMAWNYITLYGKEEATPRIQLGIRKYNEANKGKVTHGYNETVTQFYIHCIAKSIYTMPEGHTYEDFILCNQHLTNSGYLFNFYSKELLSSEKAKHMTLEPDIAPWP